MELNTREVTSTPPEPLPLVVEGTKTSPSTTTEPKKSARLAEKRKLREEADPSTSAALPPPSLKTAPTALTPPSPSKSPAGARPTFTSISRTVSPHPPDMTKHSATSILSSISVINDGGSGRTLLEESLKMGTSKEDNESSEEEWLDALESGTLEEEVIMDDALQGIQNTDLLTSRQKALLHKNDRPTLNFEPTPPKEKDFLTQEMIVLRAAKSQKRRLLAQQKKEIEKKRTMDRLLKKQHSKISKSSMKSKESRNISTSRITYLIRADMNTISFTPDTQFLIDQLKKPPQKIPEAVKCGVEGCTNMKKYSCSKTNIPLCSLQCYKINLEKLTSV